MFGFFFFFIAVPCLGIVALTCSAACRAQRPRAVKILGKVLLVPGVLGLLTPVGLGVWLFWWMDPS